MAASLHFPPVGNGDMTLIKLDNGQTFLIDCNIRQKADDENDETFDVAEWLRGELDRDEEGRLYVDGFLNSHPDQDHISGLRKHFHLGRPDDWSEDDNKILIGELFSSPIVFRRASADHTLCADAKAWNKEAKRRIAVFRDNGEADHGDRIRVLGEDEDGKTDDLGAILTCVTETFDMLNGEAASFDALLHAPLPIEDEDDEECLSKNNSSVVVRMAVHAGGSDDACLFLTGGDSEVLIWERIWEREEGSTDRLDYDVLQTPHHCSWRSMSHDSWSDLGEEAEVSEAALDALSQARNGALIIASSKPIKDEDADPPSVRAKREYEAIADDVGGAFKCVGEEPDEVNPDVLVIDIAATGPKLRARKSKRTSAAFAGVTGKLPHGAR